MAAPTFVQSSKHYGSFANGSSKTHSFASAPSTSNLLVLRIVGSVGGHTAFTVSDNKSGNTWTQRASAKNGAAGLLTQIWTCRPVQSGGTFTVSIGATGGAETSWCSTTLDEVTGFDDTTTFEATGVGGTGNNTAPTANIANTTNDCLKLGANTWYYSAATSGAAAGWTVDQSYPDNSAAQGMFAISKSVTGADTTDPTWTLSPGDEWSAVGIAIRGGGGSVPTITDSGDEAHRVGEVGVNITGTNFGAAQNTGIVKICPSNDINDVNGVTQTVTAWADTTITFNVVGGPNLAPNTNLYLFVRNDGGTANASGYVIQLTPPIAVLAYPILFQ